MIKNVSQGPESISPRISHGKHMGLFFAPRSIAVATLLSLGACGGDDTSESPPDSTTPPPVSPGPQKAQAHIELGAISGGSVTFKTLGGKVLASNIVSATDGSIEYIPEEILKALGPTEQWVLIESTGGYDTDANDDGVIDPTPTAIHGSFSVIIPRSAIEKGESFIANPRAGALTESILQRGGTITQEILDKAAKEMGASDSNKDGVVNYRDILFTSMKNVSDFSRVVPLSSGYISSIHAGDPQAKAQSLISISLTENHLSTTILPDQKNPNSHNPALEIRSGANGGKILFTLDTSSPHPNNPNTQTATGSIIIPAQNAVLYYREMFQIDGKDVLGKVQRFDLSMDWIELAEERQTYNPDGKSETSSIPYTYKNTSYTITTVSGVMNPGYTYPKHIGCYIGNTKTDGCDLGPYLAYSAAHESRIVTMIHAEAKVYIDTLGSNPKPPDPDTPPITKEESHEIVKNGTPYKTSQYWIYNDWTIGTDGKRTYPAKLSGEYQKKDGTKVAIEGGTILQASEKDTKNIALEEKIKSLIDQDINSGNSQYRQNEERIYQENPAYYGGWYKVYYYWNQNGNADYPMKIIGTYAVQNQGRQPNIEYTVYSESEKNTVTASLLADIQSKIQAGYNTNPPPTYPQGYVIDSGFINYKNGYGYNLFTTMNVNGNADYPATVYATYTSPSGGGYTQTLTARNATELSQIQNERANDAKARIDLELQSDRHPPGDIEQITNRRWYANGSFETKFQYSYNPGQDYPGYIDVSYTRGDGYGAKLTMEAANENQKYTYAGLLEKQAKLEIDNYPLYSPNTTTSTGSIPYGSHGSNYEIFAKYNRVGNGYNYPALVWIQYRSGTYGQLLDTRNTYGTTEAQNSEEKEQLKSQLESWVRSQIIAANGDMNTQYARDTTREKVLRFLPFGTAHAATESTIKVRKGAEYFGKVSPYTDPNYSIVQDFMAGVGKQAYLHQKGGNKPGVSGVSREVIQETQNEEAMEFIYRSQLSGLIMRIFDMHKAISCYGPGTTLNNCGVNVIGNVLPEGSSVYAKEGTDGLKRLGEIAFGWYVKNEFNELVEEMLKKYPSNMLYMYAIIFEEQSHLLPPVVEDLIGGSTFGLSQILIHPTQTDKEYLGYTEISKADALDGKKHLAIMNDRLNKIRTKLKELGITETPEVIGRSWNGGYKCLIGECKQEHIDYGKRVQSFVTSLEVYYNNRK